MYAHPAHEGHAHEGYNGMKKITATVTTNGRVTIPIEIRRRLGIGPGDKVTSVVDDRGKVEFRRAGYTLAEVRGIVPPLPDREVGDFEALIAEALEDRADNVVRRLRGQ